MKVWHVLAGAIVVVFLIMAFAVGAGYRAHEDCADAAMAGGKP